MRTDHRNVALLATAQALVLSSSILAITLGALVGGQLAPDPSLATLPIAAIVVGTAITTIPAAYFMRRVGRRAGFLTGATFGIASGLPGAYAVYRGAFVPFVVAHVLLGVYQGFANYYRFAAGESAAPDFRARSISWVIPTRDLALTTAIFLPGGRACARLLEGWLPHGLPLGAFLVAAGEPGSGHNEI